MTAKEYLSQLKTIEAKISNLEAEAAMLRESAYSIGSALSSDVKVCSSSSSEAAYARKVEKIAVIESQIENEKHNLIIKRDEIVKTIHELDSPIYIEILFKHYVEYKSLKQIAKETHYDYCYVRKMHGRALQNVEKRHC